MVIDWVHLHLALNHLPVVGVLFVFVLLVLGICRGSEELKRLSLQSSVVLFVVAMVVKFSGEQAAASLFPEPTPEMQSLIQAHEDSADQAVTGMFLLAAVAAVGLYRSRKTQMQPAWVTIAATVFCLVSILLMARSANLGGQIAHPEIRAASATE
ncbi:MAG: hypothetical protein M2R45_03733 [Verrucomicrobia subdivision 3 bacterium]|nr:hypothetical protein [Limisphaerales bacterium]MCS1416944.1 hypothetical protein [Limisphaerales bacterium]